jgi:hypothetical protein
VQQGNATNYSVWSAGKKKNWQGLIKIASIEAGVAVIGEIIQKVTYEYVNPAARN